MRIILYDSVVYASVQIEYSIYREDMFSFEFNVFLLINGVEGNLSIRPGFNGCISIQADGGIEDCTPVEVGEG